MHADPPTPAELRDALRTEIGRLREENARLCACVGPALAFLDLGLSELPAGTSPVALSDLREALKVLGKALAPFAPPATEAP